MTKQSCRHSELSSDEVDMFMRHIVKFIFCVASFCSAVIDLSLFCHKTRERAFLAESSLAASQLSVHLPRLGRVHKGKLVIA